MDEILEQVRAALRGIWRRRWWGLATAVVVGVVGNVAVMRLPAVYEAQARVYVDTQSILNPLMSGLAVQPNMDQQLSMMARTLLTRPNVEKVARMADLDLRATTPAAKDALLEELTRTIRFSVAGGGANLYSIAYNHSDPVVARKVVQSLLSLFVESNLGDKRRDSEQARKFIDDQIKLYEQRLIESENALKDFKIRNMGALAASSQDLVARQAELSARVTQARTDLKEAENSRDELKRQLAGETPSFALAPEPTPNTGTGAIRTELDERIELLRKRGDDLLIRYTEEHPEVINNKRVLAQLEQQRDAQRRAEQARAAAATRPGAAQAQALANNPVYQQLRLTLADSEAQVASLRARVAALEGQLSQARAAAQSVPKSEAELTQLNRDYEVNKRNYEQLIARRESAKMAGEMEASTTLAEFRVIDPPRAGAQPVSPNRPLLLAAVLIGSIVGGLAAAMMRDSIAPGIHSVGALRQLTGVPVLGAVDTVRSRTHVTRQLAAATFYSVGALAYVSTFVAMIIWMMIRQRIS